MASSSGPLTNTGNGYTIVTQVFSPASHPNATEQSSTSNPLAKFLKGEPKALGTVQIIIGLLSFINGIVLSNSEPNAFVFSGVFVWGSVFSIISGSLTVAASNKPNLCLIKGALGMSILSAIGAGVVIIILSVECAFGFQHNRYEEEGYWRFNSGNLYEGINGVLLFFNILQFFISIAISAFACKVSCRSEPMVNVITLLPNSEAGYPEINPQQTAIVNMGSGAMGQNAAFMNTVPGATGQNIGLVNTGPGNTVPLESPPPYDELKISPPV